MMSELFCDDAPPATAICPGVLAIGDIMPEVLARHGLLEVESVMEVESAEAELATA